MMGHNICFKEYEKLSLNYPVYHFLSGALFTIQKKGNLPHSVVVLLLSCILPLEDSAGRRHQSLDWYPDSHLNSDCSSSSEPVF